MRGRKNGANFMQLAWMPKLLVTALLNFQISQFEETSAKWGRSFGSALDVRRKMASSDHLHLSQHLILTETNTLLQDDTCLPDQLTTDFMTAIN